MNRFYILLSILFLGNIGKGFTQIHHEFLKDLYIIECEIWQYDTIHHTDTIIKPTSNTSLGNTVDLTAYINLQLQYHYKCVEFGYEGKSFFSIHVDNEGRFDTIASFRELCPYNDFKTQVETILKNLPQINLPSSNEFILVIKVSLIQGERIPEKPITLIQRYPNEKEKKRKRKSRD